MSEKTSRRASVARVEFFLFLLLWLGGGALINSGNLSEFNLQQIGVEAIVERGHFYLEGSAAPELYPRADVFLRDGHKYAAKQPGQFMLGAVAYFFLRPLGVTYVRDYLLASALVTFLTTTLLTALAGLCVFRLARAFAGDEAGLLWPLLSALAYGFATTAFAYSGIAHHDAIASAYLLSAFYFAFRLARPMREDEQARRDGPRVGPSWGETLTPRRARLCASAVGLLLGLTLTTSMLPFFMAAVVFVYFLALGRWRLLPHLLAGGFLGLLPLFVYDAVSFGHPLLLPNVAGNYTDTFFRFEPQNFLAKLGFYASMLALYAPVFFVGVAGLALLPREFRREQVTSACLLVVLLAYVTNIQTTGDCQYGPRYLLPAMPFAALGLAAFGRTRARRAFAVLVVAVAAFSFFVNLVGAARGAMYCQVERYALPAYLEAIARGEWRAFPLAWLAVPLAAVVLLLARAVRRARVHFTR